MQRKKKSKTTGKKPGGQPGNKNAEKHGFYSRHFNTDEQSRLASADLHSLDDEIELINVCMDRVTDLLGAKLELKDEHFKALNTLAIMMQSKSTMIRTHYITRGKGGTIEQSILEAIEELRLEMGI